jgi:branched-chain amino acid transport system permease protein
MTASSSFLRQNAWLGFIGGVVSLYLAAVGIVLAFSERNVIVLSDDGLALTLGRVMLALPPIGIGYYAARRTEGAAGSRLAAGLLAGLVTGLIQGAGLLVASALSPEIRDVLIRITPELISFVAFGLEPVVGAVVNVALCTVLGLAAASIQVTRSSVRRPIIGGFLAIGILSLAEPFVRPRLQDMDLPEIANLLYQDHGLTVIAAILAFVVGAALAAVWTPSRAAVNRRVAASDPGQQKMIRWAWALVVIAFLYALPVTIAGPFLTQVLVLVGLYILLGLGLNIVVGFAGLLDLGYVAFYAVGSYLTALLTSPNSSLGIGMSFWVALPIVVLGTAIVGLFIGAPVLRLRGDYLAIVTLGFGEIARLLFLSDALAPWLGGVQGIVGIPDMIGNGDYSLPILGEITGPATTYYPLVLLCAAAGYVAYRLKYARVGRAWNAMREDEDVAQATGVNTTNYKLLAFALGASIGSLGGAVFATHLQSVFPGSFVLQVSITTLAVVVLGGMGSIPGVVVGAFVLIGLPEMLREFAEFKLLVYGATLVLVMILRPEGLLPDVGRRRELHEAEENEEVARGAAPSQA